MTTAIQISEQLLGEIFVALQRDFPKEGCGLLLGVDGRIREVVPSPNLSGNAERAFEIDPGLRLRTQRRAREAGLQILGHYHSHPFGEPKPSDCDQSEAHEPDLIWFIMGLRWGGPQGLAAWQLSPDAEPVRVDTQITD